MKKRLSLAVLVVLVAACFARASRRSGAPSQAVTSGGHQRSFVEYLPAHPAGKPLIVSLHGRLGTAEGQNALSHLAQLAESDEAAVVFPQGVDKSWADFRNATPASKQGIDDVAFLRELIDDRLAKYQLDATRVYMLGMSNGGFMTLFAVCQLSDKLAAVASITGGVAVQTENECPLARPIPVAMFMGEQDPLVPFDGGVLGKDRGQIVSAHEGAALFARKDGCTSQSDTQLPAAVDDGTSVSLRTFSACREETEVRLYTIHGGGHTWPGGDAYLPEFIIGKTSQNLDASAEAWKFFQRFHR